MRPTHCLQRARLCRCHSSVRTCPSLVEQRLRLSQAETALRAFICARIVACPARLEPSHSNDCKRQIHAIFPSLTCTKILLRHLFDLLTTQRFHFICLPVSISTLSCKIEPTELSRASLRKTPGTTDSIRHMCCQRPGLAPLVTMCYSMAGHCMSMLHLLPTTTASCTISRARMTSTMTSPWTCKPRTNWPQKRVGSSSLH